MNEKTNVRQKEKFSAPRAPYKMLLLCAILLPCLNILTVGSAMLITNYFGAFYAYNAAGVILTLLSELLSSAFKIVNHCLLICTLMTLASYLFKKDVKSTLLPTLFAFLAGFFEIACSSLTLAATVTLGVSDSTAALPNQLIPLILSKLVLLLLRGLLFAAVLLVFFLVKRKSSDLRIVCYENTPFAITCLCFVIFYTLVLFVDPITVALSPAEGGNLFSNYILPFLDPLIYGGFMLMTLLFFPRYLARYYKRMPLIKKKSRKKASASESRSTGKEQKE